MPANQIMVVDDEVGIRELLFEILRDEGYGVRLAENAQTARSLRKEMRPDLVLLDIWMPDTDGVTLLKEWASTGMLTMPVIWNIGTTASVTFFSWLPPRPTAPGSSPPCPGSSVIVTSRSTIGCGVAFGNAQPENPLMVKNFEVAPGSGRVLTLGIAGTFLECTANRMPLLLCRTDCAAV